MGQDKALVLFHGLPLIARVIERVSPLADELIITTNTPDKYAFLGLPLYQDVLPGTGALGGLFTALSAARGELVAVVACDMPFVSPEILALARDSVLSNEVDVAIPLTEDGYEPFHAVYRRKTCQPAVKEALDAGKRKLISWFDSIRILALDPAQLFQYDPGRIAFRNINTPEELLEAERLAEFTG